MVYVYVRVCVCTRMCTLSRFSHIQLFVILWTTACQAPLSMRFSRQEYWSGLPFSDFTSGCLERAEKSIGKFILSEAPSSISGIAVTPSGPVTLKGAENA